jgi:ABC-type dipeptide/oligopeptide/nickel transport system permease subunit
MPDAALAIPRPEAGSFVRLLRHRSAAAGLVLVLLAVLMALLCPWIAPFDPIEQYRASTGLPPGGLAPEVDAEIPQKVFHLGTDISGRDVLSRVLYGARISLLVGVVATIISLLIGVTLGLLAGYFGGWLDLLLMRITDVFFAFPGILLAIVLLATLNQPSVREALVGVSGKVDPGIWGLFIALGVTGWTGIARVIRGEVLALKEREFVEAARAIGASHARIIFVHLLPNTLPLVIVLGTMAIADNILGEAGLSFLGLGVQPPAASWGGMLAEGRPYLTTMPWWGLYPGLALALTVLGFNLLGDGLRDVLDPRLRRSL